jgi:hypothetical protein
VAGSPGGATPASIQRCTDAVVRARSISLNGVAAGVFDAEDGPNDEFIFGLDRILDGIEDLIRSRTGRSAGQADA